MSRKALWFLILTTACVLCSCKSFGVKPKPLSNYENVHNQLAKMESYACESEIKIVSNKSSSTYTIRQFCKKTGEYRIETLNPEMLSGSVTTFDGTQLSHYNPRIRGKLSIAASGENDNVETLLTTFLKNYEGSDEVSVLAGNFDESDTTVLEAKIPGEHPYFSSEKLWVDNKTLAPTKLVIYDPDDSERVVVTYSRFEYNVKLEDNVFKLGNAN